MNLIDVTLRDGGHAVKFDWPLQFAKDYYKLMCNIDTVKYIELGYWKQTEKSTNMFYNLNDSKVSLVTEGAKRKNVAIMIDYHYCSHNLNDYPTSDQDEIAMIRMCCRKEDIDDGLKFACKLKEHTNIDVSINIFNISSYTNNELYAIADRVSAYNFDFVYFADTHGALDLSVDMLHFTESINRIRSSGTKFGFHLHDHSGNAVSNYKELVDNNVDSSDTSIMGMGKGSGNLKLEHVVTGYDLVMVAEFIEKYKNVLILHPTPYGLITSMYGITDNYATTASQLNMDMKLFNDICKSISGIDKDTYNPKIITEKI
jgi:4-hydroxy 2-oxovalerate aldolase